MIDGQNGVKYRQTHIKTNETHHKAYKIKHTNMYEHTDKTHQNARKLTCRPIN